MRWILLLLIVSLCSAQESLGLKDAVRLALEKNREILQLKKEIMSLEDIYRAQKWDRFSPKVDLFVDKDGFNFFGQILLLDFGNRLARIRSAEMSTRIKRELLKELERQVKIRIAELFMELALAEKLAEVRREEMAVAYVRFDRERERLDRGLSDRVKVAEWEATYTRFRAQLREAQRKYNQTLFEIKRILGVDVSKPLEVRIDLLNDFEVPRNKTIDTSYLLGRFKNNYLLKVKSLEIAYFESRAKEQRRILYPELYAYLEVKNRYENFSKFRSEGNVVLRVPLFDGKASFYRERSFLDLKRAIEVEKKEVSERIREEILRAPYEWEELYAEYEDAITFDRWAQENLDLSRSNYELELAFDLGYAMSTKTEAERRLMEAKFKIIVFLMKLYDLIGEDPMKVFEGDIPFFAEKVEEI
jgi:outer membrane protein TolC